MRRYYYYINTHGKLEGGGDLPLSTEGIVWAPSKDEALARLKKAGTIPPDGYDVVEFCELHFDGSKEEQTYRYPIRLDTLSDVRDFVAVAEKIPAVVKLIDGQGFCVNGKSLLGTVAALEWSDLYVLSNADISEQIKAFLK